jgi:1,4-dihydroxy-6-naphthoate synthase
MPIDPFFRDFRVFRGSIMPQSAGSGSGAMPGTGKFTFEKPAGIVGIEGPSGNQGSLRPFPHTDTLAPHSTRLTDKMTTETQTQIIRVGHSPDPDDAFMFHALANDKIDTGRYRFVHELQDIETLNRRAFKGELELTAVSLHGYAYLTDKYALCACGASMGDGYGPMVVTREPMSVEDLEGLTIAVPGTLTTAFLALNLCLGGRPNDFGFSILDFGFEDAEASSQIQNPKSKIHTGDAGTFRFVVHPFDQILNVVARGEADAGLIIHEGQLTYGDQGLELVVDLGEWWMQETGLPLPLGGNAIRKDLGREGMEEVTALLKQSIQYGLDHRDEALNHALQYGRDLDWDAADTFVGMYVNDWTLDFGERGREAVATLLRRGHEAGIIPNPVDLEFIE